MKRSLWIPYLGYLWETRVAQWWRSGRNLARYAWNHRRRRRMPGRPVVYLDIVDDMFHRYLFSLYHYFDVAGYDVFLRFRRALVGRMCYYARFLLRSPHCYICRQAPAGARMTFTFPEGAVGDARALDPDYFREAQPDEYHVPIGLYVDMYRGGLDRECVRRSAAADRPVRIFFAGNLDPTNYALHQVETCFGCLRRPVLIGEALALRGELRVLEPATLDALRSIEDRVDLVVVDTARFQIPAHLLPAALARSAFFLAPPGTVMPLCHNIMEAMAAGCVPILEFAHWMYPALEDGVTCVAFRGVDGLRAALRRAVAMSEAEVQALRANVRGYYARHLAPEAVVREIENRYGSLRRILVNAEHASVAILRRRQSVGSAGGA